MNWFKRKTNYPKQSLSDKQKNLLDAMDTFLVEGSNSKLMSNPLSIKTFKIGIYSQHLTVTYLLSNLTAQLKEQDFAYIPRTVSLIVDADGTWCCYIGVRNSSVIDETTTELFIDSLRRTNQARVE